MSMLALNSTLQYGHGKSSRVYNIGQSYAVVSKPSRWRDVWQRVMLAVQAELQFETCNIKPLHTECLLGKSVPTQTV